MALSTSQTRLLRPLLYLIGVIIIALVLWPIPRASVWKNYSGDTGRLLNIRNATLGVQKIFAISLPSRLDKRDNIVLGSSISNFEVDFIDGVVPDEINPKTYPYNWNSAHRAPEYAARRAHVNAMQRIVKERISSAIITEDDVDWDVAIKSQLQSFAVATRALQGTDGATVSPYGDNWDIFWLGHCGVECRTDQAFFLSPDPTVLPPSHFLPYWRDPPPLEKPDNTRLTCAISDGVCSIAYAVSYEGAQRILSALSVNPSGIAEKVDIGAQFDVSLGRMCSSGYLRCFAPYPSITGVYSSGGASKKGSDINGGDGIIDGPMEGPSSYGVMYSTMMNINRILGGMNTIHSNWDDLPVPDIHPDDIHMVNGTIQTPKVQ